jgi:hypothetical protein
VACFFLLLLATHHLRAERWSDVQITPEQLSPGAADSLYDKVRPPLRPKERPSSTALHSCPRALCARKVTRCESRGGLGGCVGPQLMNMKTRALREKEEAAVFAKPSPQSLQDLASIKTRIHSQTPHPL